MTRYPVHSPPKPIPNSTANTQKCHSSVEKNSMITVSPWIIRQVAIIVFVPYFSAIIGVSMRLGMLTRDRMLRISAAWVKLRPLLMANGATNSSTIPCPAQPSPCMAGRFQNAFVRRTCWLNTLVRARSCSCESPLSELSPSRVPYEDMPMSAGLLLNTSVSNRINAPAARPK